LETTFSGSLLEAYCQQIKICTEIALTSIDDDPHRRPTINEIIAQLIESETSISNLEMDPRGKAISSMHIFFPLYYIVVLPHYIVTPRG
jgi:hypothetical protein